MIDAAALRKQAANKYPEVVAALLRGEAPFPITLRYSRIRTTDSRESILNAIHVLKGESREHLGHGLTIQWTEINTIKYGLNKVPDTILLADEADYMGYVGKIEEWRSIRLGYTLLVEAFPQLATALPSLWRDLRDGSIDYWQQVIAVLEFFQQSPFPERYTRELPIPVPTKFIEENYTLFEKFIPLVAPDAMKDDGETFEERLGLKRPDALVECRLLDDALLPGWQFRQFTVGVRDLEYLAALPAPTIIITENRINFLTLPPAPGTIAFQGQGYAVRRLRRARFLHSRHILYWGDMDAQGFEILAVLRREFPHVDSLMMDLHTWEQFAHYRVPGVRSRNDPALFIPFLTTEEREVYARVTSGIVRLEQERIPQNYVNAQIGFQLEG
ncbi:MAG: DUF2220 family protein [Verrucomicrobiota bacterium]|nr:DUF2220 family protein [Verrucomicrobiota bacterium]